MGKGWKQPMKRFLCVLMLLLLCCGAALAEDIGEIQSKQDVLYVNIGKQAEVKYRLTTEALRKSSFAYEISDPAIASVDTMGYVKGLAVGECELKITSKRYPEVSTTVPVRVIQPVKKVVLETAQAEVNVGQKFQIGCTTEPADATIQGVTFTSSDEKVALVNRKNGIVRAVGRGTATITVASKDGNARATFKVTVRQLPEEITFKKDEYTYRVGKAFEFGITVKPGNANNKTVTWSSSDESVATVNKYGSVKVIGEGTTVITATSQADPTVKGTTIINGIHPIKAIEFEQDYYELKIGDVLELNPILTPENATPWAVTYAAANPYICKVDEDGTVTAAGGGITTVTAYSSESKSIKSTVKIAIVVEVESVHFDEKGIRVPVGEHAFATAKVRPGDATFKDMTWVSSNPEVAIVTNSSHRPRIEGLKWGRCTITGTTVRGGYSASINVNIGALHDAITVYSASAAGGKISLMLNNHSDMHFTGLTLAFTTADGSVIEKQIAADIAPFAINAPVEVEIQGAKEAAVMAWETDTGYYTNMDVLKNSYRISSGLMDWKTVK